MGPPSLSPSTTITVEGKSSPNPAYLAWHEADQWALLILQSSLLEEAMAESLGSATAREIWKALEQAYNRDSCERLQTLHDSLIQLKKGSSFVNEFGKKFKALCDQLVAIGHPMDDSDKAHYFLCGLGSTFYSFSTSHRKTHVYPSFHNLLSQAESHEMVMSSVHSSLATTVAAFTAQTHANSSTPTASGSPSNRGKGRGSYSGGRGRGKRSPHCQLCRKNGHYASACPDLASYAQQGASIDANLAHTFHSQCNVNSSTPDWYVDSGASSHMTKSSSHLDSSSSYTGKRSSCSWQW